MDGALVDPMDPNNLGVAAPPWGPGIRVTGDVQVIPGIFYHGTHAWELTWNGNLVCEIEWEVNAVTVLPCGPCDFAFEVEVIDPVVLPGTSSCANLQLPLSLQHQEFGIGYDATNDVTYGIDPQGQWVITDHTATYSGVSGFSSLTYWRVVL